jgi:O-antigen/teichoic acid export membrane protein
MRAAPARLFSSSLIVDAGLVLAAAFGLLFHLMAARGLGPSTYGAFTAALSFVTLWAVVMEGGIGLALTREASADPRRLVWASDFARWRRRLTWLGVAGAVASAALLGFETRVVGLVAILAVGMAALSFMRLGFAIVRALGRFTWEAVPSAAQKALLVLLTAGALALGTGVAGVAAAFTLSYAITAVPAVSRAWRAVTAATTSAGDIERPPPGFFLRTCVPLFAIELLTGLYFKTDQVLLLRLRGADETGWYAAAYRVIEALLLLLAGVMTVLFPRLAASARGAPETFRADFARAWRTLWVSGAIVALNGWLWAVGLVPLVFGVAYAPAQALLNVLLGAIPLMYVNYLLTQSLVAAGRERFYALAAGLCALVNVGLNLLLIPQWGAAAAAWITLATEGVLFVSCLWGLRALAPVMPLSSTAISGLAVALAVAGGWWALADRPIERALLALAVSALAWEMMAPWSLRELLARGARRRS